MNIIQIGTNDGKDHVYDFISKNVDNIIDRVILVDANPNCIIQTVEQYSSMKNVEVFNYAIVVDENADKFIDIYYPSHDKTSAHSSVLQAHMTGHGHTYLESAKVATTTLNDFFQSLGVTTIDRLYIDVEGLDVAVVNSVDFNKFDIKYLEFEFIHSDHTLSWGGPKLQECLIRLEQFGFSYSKNGYNIVATR